MYENSNDKKNFFYIVILILTLITMIVGITFALYSLMASQKKDNTILYTGKLELNFIDGIYIDNPTLFPRNVPSVNDYDNVYRNNFVVTSTGTLDQRISISVEMIENTFNNGNIKYALYNANNVLMSSGNLPKAGVVNMANNLFLGYNESARYLLLVWFDDNGENQNEDMGKVIKAKINVESIQIRK